MLYFNYKNIFYYLMENEEIDVTSEYFKLPIEYERSINVVNDNIISDFGIDSDESPYNKLFRDGNKINELLINKWSTYFSSNKDFLKGNQEFIDSFKNDYLNKLVNTNNGDTVEITQLKRPVAISANTASS